MTAITASHLSRRLQFSCPFFSSVMTASIGNLRGSDIITDPLMQLKNLTENEPIDRKSTRLNSSHLRISYAVFCLKKTRQGRGPDHGEDVGRGGGARGVNGVLG